jgi:predicted ATPase
MQLIEDAQPFNMAGQSPEDAIPLTLQLLQGIAYIHRRGLLHRDLKPSNVLVKNGHVHIVDFGLAVTTPTDTPKSKMDVAGTLAYIAPETFAHGHISPRSDLYAVGVMLYELLSGKHPYWDMNPMVLMNHILHYAVDVSQLDISPDMMIVLSRLLSKDPQDRYLSAEEAMSALCAASEQPIPLETSDIRESFLQAATFVGRKDESAQLQDALVAVNQGKGSAWLIGGESGVGKSRLIQEVATRALVSGGLLLRCQATLESTVGYGMWRDALRRLVLSTTVTDDEAILLKAIIPSIDTLLERDIPDVDIPELNQRLPMVVDALLHRAAKQQPIVLILEDLQWVAESTHEMKLISMLMNLSSALPLMILASYRDDECPNLPQLLPNAQSIQLQRLTPEEIARLSASMLGDAGKRPQVVNFLNQHTEGNVFFIIEVVRVLAEEAGRITDIGLSTLPTHVIAEGVQRVVSYRLAQLPDWARTVVNIAAVAGRGIDLVLMQVLAPDIDINLWLDICVNAAVLDVQDGMYRFSHDKLREGVLDGLSAVERKRYHKHIADTLQTVYPDSLDDVAVIIAKHYYSAEEDSLEALFVLNAANRAFALSNYQEAAYFYGRAHTLGVHRQAQNPPLQSAHIMLGMGKCAYSLSDYETCRHWSEQAAALFQNLGDEVSYADAINTIGESYFRQGENSKSHPLLMAALEIRQRLHLKDQVGYTLMNLGVVAAQQGQLEEAEAYFLRCYEAMQQANDPIGIARAMNNLAIINELLSNLNQSEDYHRQALDIRRKINDRVGIAYSLLNLAQLMRKTHGDSPDCEYMLLESLSLLRTLGERLALAAVLGALGDFYISTGDYFRAESYLQESLQIRLQIGDKLGQSISYNSLALLALRHNNTYQAWQLIQHALKITAGLSNLERYIEDLCSLADVLDARHHFVEALAIYECVQSYWVAENKTHQRASSIYNKLLHQLTTDQIKQAKAMFSGWSLEDVVTHFANIEQ